MRAVRRHEKARIRLYAMIRRERKQAPLLGGAPGAFGVRWYALQRESYW